MYSGDKADIADIKQKATSDQSHGLVKLMVESGKEYFIAFDSSCMICSTVQGTDNIIFDW